MLRLCQNVTNGLHVNEKIVDRAIREYLPFLATENIMMEAVKRGGDRQELHEKIRQHSMAATARMKEGEPCDLLDRLAADPAFGMTRAELDAVMEPSLYIGRAVREGGALVEGRAPPVERSKHRRRHQPVNTKKSAPTLKPKGGQRNFERDTTKLKSAVSEGGRTVSCFT